MPSNDTENIYATQYGGEGEPIPATKVSYDGAGTSIAATNVQAAITEVDTDLQNTKEDVSDLKTALRENFIINSTTEKVSVTADGVKSYNTLLGELRTALLAKIAALEDDEKLIINTASIGGVGVFKITGKSAGYVNTDNAFTLYGDRMAMGATSILIQCLTIGTTNGFYSYAGTNVPAVTITDMLSTAPSEDNTLVLDCWVVKQV